MEQWKYSRFLIKVFKIVFSDTSVGCTCVCCVVVYLGDGGGQRMCEPNLAVTTSTEKSGIPSHTQTLYLES